VYEKGPAGPYRTGDRRDQRPTPITFEPHRVIHSQRGFCLRTALSRSHARVVRTAHPWVLPDQPTIRVGLLALGLTDHMIRTRVSSGELITVRHGVFVRADGWPAEAAAQHVVRACAEQAANPSALISHQSAAAALGLPSPGFQRWEELPVSITLPPGHSSKSGLSAHHVGPVPASQVVRDSTGYLMTSPARTAVDLSADLPLPQALVVLDGAARLIVASFVSQVRRRDYANPTLAGAARDLQRQAAESIRAARLRSPIDLMNPCRESAAESLSAGHMHLVGIPTPGFQAEIRTARRIYFPDFLWEEQRLIGECDGAVKYTDPTAYVAEKEREQDLRDSGWRFVRWLPKEVMLRPSEVMNRIERALGR